MRFKAVDMALVLLLVGYMSGCADSRTTTIKRKVELEISPGKWLVLERKLEVYTSDLEARGNPPKNPHQLSLIDAFKQVAGRAVAAKNRAKPTPSMEELTPSTTFRSQRACSKLAKSGAKLSSSNWHSPARPQIFSNIPLVLI